AVGRDGLLSPEQVGDIIESVAGGSNLRQQKPVEVRQGGNSVRARTPGQADYIEAIRNHDLVFCVGPAGTGKTYLAVATAVEALKANQIRKIVLVRPAVEAGESLGY